MSGQESHLDFLRKLSREELNQELKQEVTASLQELVACVERTLPSDETTRRSCVIDDFRVVETDLGERNCRLELRFNASSRGYESHSGELEQMAGRAEAVIDDAGRVAYRNVSFATEEAFVQHDVGGGD